MLKRSVWATKSLSRPRSFLCGLALFLLLSAIGHAMPIRPAEAQQVGEVFRDCAVCPEMVVVPAGRFLMGSPETEAGRRDNEGPQRQVSIGYAFAVGVYEVTTDEWAACVQGGACPALYEYDTESEGRLPVWVEWDPAWQYADWLSKITGHEYRLPSEAEWEYAARAGTRPARYWGESPNEQCQYANGYDPTARSELGYEHKDMTGCRDGHAYGAPVGSLRPNGWRLYDVLGNVPEWVDDCWNNSYEGAPSDGSPRHTGDCLGRVSRGGGALDEPQDLRSARRNLGVLGLETRGFRVARSVP